VSRLLTFLVALVVIAALFFFSRGPGVADTQKAAEHPVEEPGYRARNAEMIETGDDGRAMYTLIADLVRQHPNDNRVQLDAPRMTFVASDGNTWYVTARSGQIREDGSNVELFGDVHVNGRLPGADAPAVIETSVLSFDTRKEVVSTHAPVELDWNGRKLSGTGLTAKLPEHQIRLESRIHGSFSAN
jgi:lipopolysaccharide export system protein LptC